MKTEKNNIKTNKHDDFFGYGNKNAGTLSLKTLYFPSNSNKLKTTKQKKI